MGSISIRVEEMSPHDAEAGVMGLYEGFPRPRILIASGLDPDIRFLTLLHEVLHAIDDIYGLGLEEQQVRILEQTLGTLIKNPDQLLKG